MRDVAIRFRGSAKYRPFGKRPHRRRLRVRGGTVYRPCSELGVRRWNRDNYSISQKRIWAWWDEAREHLTAADSTIAQLGSVRLRKRHELLARRLRSRICLE